MPIREIAIFFLFSFESGEIVFTDSNSQMIIGRHGAEFGDFSLQVSDNISERSPIKEILYE